MRFRLFYHSLVSDWNHGNAHFLRGVASELIFLGHDVVVYEPAHGWSVSNLVAEHGHKPLRKFRSVYPHLRSVPYDPETFDCDEALADADVVLVHEWNSPELIRRVGEARRRQGFLLFFHDTHHRLVTDPHGTRANDLSQYDGVLAYGKVLRDIYLAEGLTQRAWIWHEAADVRVFRPMADEENEGDLVWIGNWGDGERTEELTEFLMDPVRRAQLRARAYGVRYPEEARHSLTQAGVEYAGWVPNYEVPRIFGRFRATVHIPRRPYVRVLPGIPTIRPIEAMACGIPLVCSPWNDSEHLFHPGRDYLVAANGRDMERHLRALMREDALRRDLAAHALETIHARHTCAHRVDELMEIIERVKYGGPARSPRSIPSEEGIRTPSMA